MDTSEDLLRSFEDLKVEETNCWDQLLELESTSGSESKPNDGRIISRDPSPGTWDSSSFLSRSPSGYINTADYSHMKCSDPIESDQENEFIRFVGNEWHPAVYPVYRGQADTFLSQMVPLLRSNVPEMHVSFSDIDATDVFSKSDRTQELDENININQRKPPELPLASSARASAGAQSRMPTYATNPWAIIPSDASFTCRWSPDTLSCAESPSNGFNDRIHKLIENHSIPNHTAKSSCYYLGKSVLRDPHPAIRRFPLPRQEHPRIYQVHFKHYYRDYVTHPCLLHPIHVGDAVCVEGDRGEDIGHVTHVSMISKELPLGRLGFILRHATPEEKYLLPIKAKEEWSALEMCRRKVFEHLLPMNILDAEFQFDRRKLTFFFEARGRIDFRDLVPQLFTIYKTRIWMQQVTVGSDGEFTSAFV